jgi:hypothetical protein
MVGGMVGMVAFFALVSSTSTPNIDALDTNRFSAKAKTIPRPSYGKNFFVCWRQQRRNSVAQLLCYILWITNFND